MRKFNAIHLPVLLVAFTVVVCCSDDDQPGDAGRDGGRDAGMDGGRDGGLRRDGGRDGGNDAGPIDPEWAPMPGLPDYCIVERALHPEALFVPEWVDCGEGCRRLAEPRGLLRVFNPQVGAHDGDRGYFRVVQGESTDSPSIAILAATDGPPMGAWRYPAVGGGHLCQVFPTAIYRTAAAFVIRTDDEERYYHAPIETIGSVTDPVALLGGTWLRGGGSATQRLAVSDTTVVGEVQLAGYIAVVDDGVLGGLADGAGPANATPQRPQVLGHVAYWTDWGASVRVARGALPGPEEIYLERAGRDILGFRVDDNWIAWQEAATGAPATSSVDLWASPFAEDPAALMPRVVATLDSYSSGYTMGSGIYAYTRADRIELYDLTDGRRRTFTMPPSTRADDAPLYITPDEMLIPGRIIGGRTGPIFTLFRVQLAALPYET